MLGSDGNFYGTSSAGGLPGQGIVFQLSLSSAPSITSANSATFTEGVAGSFTVTATGNPAPTFSATGLPSWASLNSTTGVLSGTPTDATGSPFSVTITAANGYAPNATQTFTLTVQTPLNFSAWEASFPNPITSGPTATPENDGVPNFLKYLFDIDPGRPMSATDLAALPALGMTSLGGTEYLTLSFRQYTLETGLNISVLTSSDLQTWQPVSDPTFTKIGTDATTGDSIMQVQVPMTGSKQFLRLNVTTQ